tara:strand:- start:29 stop:187 length:159 start_codon:yes stop_codon:yes gene_type:complete
MKTYQISLKYVAYAHYTIEADSLEEAEAQAGAQAHEEHYGEWSTDSIEEVTA